MRKITKVLMTITFVSCMAFCISSCGFLSNLGQCEHVWKEEIKLPTCLDSEGYTLFTCEKCEESYKTNQTFYFGEHNYSQGACLVCGESEYLFYELDADNAIDLTKWV